MKILITEFMEVKCVEVLKINFDVTVDHDLSANSNELKKIISEFDALIVRNKTQVKKEVLEKRYKSLPPDDFHSIKIIREIVRQEEIIEKAITHLHHAQINLFGMT